MARGKSGRAGAQTRARARADLNPSGPNPSSTLPNEILITITYFLDLPTALSFALTSRQFRACVSRRIWRDLDVSGFGGKWDNASESAREGDLVPLSMLHKTKLEAKLKKIKNRGGKKRYGMVERMRVAPRPGYIVDTLIELLVMVSPNLQELSIEAATGRFIREDYDPREHATLDSYLLRHPAQFPSLTYVHIDPQSIQCGEFLPLLCNSAPNLITLVVHMRHVCIPTAADAPATRFPDFAHDTRIRHLSIAFCDEDSFEERAVPLDFAEVSPDHPILSLLRRCPKTERLSINYIAGAYVKGGGVIFDDVREAIKDWRMLREVDWQAWSGTLWDLWDLEQPDAFLTLRRCILQPREAAELFENMPSGDHLEHVHFIRSYKEHDLNATYSLIPSACIDRLSQAQLLLPFFSSALCRSPLLRLISIGKGTYEEPFMCFQVLDEIERSGSSAGFVDSYRNGGSELLHLRFLLDLAEVSDISYDTIQYVPQPFPTTAYEYHDGDTYSKDFAFLPAPVQQHFTSFEDRVVPLEIIEKMRNIEGKSVEEWQQRGVVVGDEAWAVLMRYMAEPVMGAKQKFGEVVPEPAISGILDEHANGASVLEPVS